MFRAFVIALALVVGGMPGWAQSMPSIYVQASADDDSRIAKCDVSYRSSVAAVQSALRYNRVNTVRSPSTGALGIYLTLLAVEITEDFCAVSYQLELYEPSNVDSPATGAKHFAWLVYSKASGISSDEKRDMQGTVNDSLKELLDVLLAEYEQSVL